MKTQSSFDNKAKVLKALARRWLCLIAVMVGMSSVLAEEIIIESRIPNANLWATTGSWVDSTLKSSAPGLQAAGSKFTVQAASTVKVTPTLQAGDLYLVQITHGSAATLSTNLLTTINQEGCTGLKADTDAFQNRRGANRWYTIGTLTVDGTPGDTTKITLTFSYCGDVNTCGCLGPTQADCRWYWDAIRFFNLSEPCLQGLDMLDTVNGPLAAGQMFVEVPNVESNANVVTVFAISSTATNQIGQLITLDGGITNGRVTVPLDTPLVFNQMIVATQRNPTNDVDSCLPSLGPRVGAGANPRIRISLSLREMNPGVSLPIGSPAGTNALDSYLFMPATGTVGGGFDNGPTGGILVQPGTCWQTVTINPMSDLYYFWSGSKVRATTGLEGSIAALDGVGFCIDDFTTTGPFDIYIDNFKNGDIPIQEFETTTNTESVLFLKPSSGWATGLLAPTPGDVSPDISMVTNYTADTGSNALRLSFQFKNTNNVNWVRLSAGGTNDGGPRPVLSLTNPISFRMLILPIGQTNGVMQISELGDRTVFRGDNLTYTVTASGTGPFSYQWRYNGVDIPGATTDSYTVNNVQTNKTGVYAVAVTGPTCSSMTDSRLSLYLPPNILQQPTNTLVEKGVQAVLSVVAEGTEPMFYQWYREGSPLVEGGNILGSTTASLTFLEAGSGDIGNYTVGISNFVGGVTSAVAALTVNFSPFQNGSFEYNGLYPWENGDLPTSDMSLGTYVVGYNAWFTNVVPTDGIVALAHSFGSSNSTGTIYISQDVVIPTVAKTLFFDYRAGWNTVGKGATQPRTFSVQVIQPTNNAVLFNTNILTISPNTSNPDTGNRTVQIDLGAFAGTNIYRIKFLWTVPEADKGPAFFQLDRISLSPLKPSITAQPVGFTNAVAGTNITLTVVADPNSLPNYRWSKDGVELYPTERITGVTAASLNINPLKPSDAGVYKCLVYNGAGSVTSAPVSISVICALKVTVLGGLGTLSISPNQPTYAPYSQVTLSFTPAANFSFVGWGYTNGYTNPISPMDVYMDDSYEIACVVSSQVQDIIMDNPDASTNGSWAGTSSSTDKYQADYIYSTSVSISTAPTARATYRPTIPVTGNYNVYVWYPQGSSRPVDAPYIVSCQEGNFTNRVNQTTGGGKWNLIGRRYFAAGTNGFIRIENNTATAGKVVMADGIRLAFSTNYQGVPAHITTQPQGQTNSSGVTVVLSATAAGDGPLVYQWRKGTANLANGGGISGVTTPNLTLANLVTTNAGNYVLVVTNTGAIATSQVAVVSVVSLNPPLITTHPVSVTNTSGTTATFSVTATGTAPLLYQWLKNGMVLSDGGSISGSASNVLTLANVLPADAAGYSVIVSNSVSSATSTTAVLTVTTRIIMPALSPSNLSLNWTPGFVLQSATNVAGPWNDVPGATSPFTADLQAQKNNFFRLRTGP